MFGQKHFDWKITWFEKHTNFEYLLLRLLIKHLATDKKYFRRLSIVKEDDTGWALFVFYPMYETIPASVNWRCYPKSQYEKYCQQAVIKAVTDQLVNVRQYITVLILLTWYTLICFNEFTKSHQVHSVFSTDPFKELLPPSTFFKEIKEGVRISKKEKVSAIKRKTEFCNVWKCF